MYPPRIKKEEAMSTGYTTPHTVISFANDSTCVNKIKAIISSIMAVATINCPVGVFMIPLALKMDMAIHKDVRPKQNPLARDAMVLFPSMMATVKPMRMGRMDLWTKFENWCLSSLLHILPHKN